MADRRENVGGGVGAGLSYSFCERRFTTRSGRGLHERRAHEREFMARIERDALRWSDEESAMLAAAEVEIGPAIRGMALNEALALRLGTRSAEAIKGQRRKASYRCLLESVLEERTREPGAGVGLAADQMAQNDDGHVARVRRLVEWVEVQGDVLRQLGGRRWGPEAARLACAIDDETQGVAHCRSPVLEWLKGVFPSVGEVDTRAPCSTWAPRPRPRGGARRQRVVEYAVLQELWSTDRKAAAKRVLGLKHGQGSVLPAELFGKWTETFEAPSTRWLGDQPVCPDVLYSDDPFEPISVAEVESTEPDRKSAAGRDGVSPSDWRAVLFNVLLIKGEVPEELACGRTTFIPKIPEARNPGDYRPITVASVVIRQLHRILARRLEGTLANFPDQAGFRRGVDRIGRHVDMLNRTLSNAWSRRREVHLAVFDFAKAFDSVSHEVLLRTLDARRTDPVLARYLRNLLAASTTRLYAKGQYSREIRCNRGVRQGDPLSGALFNCAMDHALGSLPERVGYWMDGVRRNALAYADDIVLMASSRPGLQTMIDRFCAETTRCGLNLNVDKCFTVSVVPRLKLKSVIIASRPFSADLAIER